VQGFVRLPANNIKINYLRQPPVALQSVAGPWRLMPAAHRSRAESPVVLSVALAASVAGIRKHETRNMGIVGESGLS
jgi:hypothetical protein